VAKVDLQDDSEPVIVAVEFLAPKHVKLKKNRPNKAWPHGAQVDLLLDRADLTISLIEIKFSQGPFTITKSYAQELRQKVEVFKQVTGTKKNVFLTFLTTHGLTQNAYATELVQTSITTDCLFVVIS